MKLGKLEIKFGADKFPREYYGSALESILKAAQDDYKQITYERRARQQFILRTYLWLSTIILGAQIPLLGHIKSQSIGFTVVPWVVLPTPYFYLWATLSIALSTVAFVLGVDTMRGRGETHFPYKLSYEKLLDLAYRSASNAQKDVSTLRETWCIEMVRSLGIAIENERKQAGVIGKKLRNMSYIILASVFCTACALAPTFIEYPGNLPPKEVKHMSDNKDAPPPPSEVQTPTQAPSQSEPQDSSSWSIGMESLTGMIIESDQTSRETKKN